MHSAPASLTVTPPVAYGLLTLVFFVTVVLNEVLPFAFGTGRAAIVPAWGFVYVTLRFILLPASALVLMVWGLISFLSRLRHHAGFSTRIALLLFVPIAFLALSYFVPLPWLFTAVYGLHAPNDVPGWFR